MMGSSQAAPTASAASRASRRPAATLELRDSTGMVEKVIAAVEGEVYRIGRDAAKLQNGQEMVTVHLREQSSVSRSHVLVRLSDGKVFLQDLNSLHGTYLDDRRCEPGVAYQMRPGMRARLGCRDLSLKFIEIDLRIPGWTPDAESIKSPRRPVPSPGASTSTQALAPAEDSHAHAAKETLAKRRQSASASTMPEHPMKRRQSVCASNIEVPPAKSRRLTEERGPTLPQHSPMGTALSSANGQAAKSAKPITCDKCDGPHATDACPHYRKAREQHKDAWVNYGKKHPCTMGSDGGNFFLKRNDARIVPQPGDGSCLFHSLCFGLKQVQKNFRWDAITLRRELARFVQEHPQLEIAGDTLEEWVRWDANKSCDQYASKMAHTGWGGGVEMAACSHLKRVNVHVYEQRGHGQFKRISCFNFPRIKDAPTLHVLYQGRMHFDALLVN
mmetsp:Transcript_115436/g.203857  ORF Transcript_115436/g.203857 Transcript_115436/m.203857 type:complete len:444 (-) Transcript_115436:120-1451(-)